MISIRKSRLSDKGKRTFRSFIEDSFSLDVFDLKNIIKSMHFEMEKGLGDTEESSLAMVPSYVAPATGKEEGHFIAVDFGGTNLRVIVVKLLGNGVLEVKTKDAYKIPKELITSNAEKLFDFLADAVKETLVNSLLIEKKIKLGFTFSFMVNQTSVNSGSLIKWTKEFDVSGVVNEDVVKLFEVALIRKNITNVKISALVNDTIGTLISKEYSNEKIDVGVILGTGTNACYIEETKNIKKMAGKFDNYQSDKMLINMEWGNFNLIPRNYYDHILDKNSSAPSFQCAEKMISGLYLGELTRIVFQDLIERHFLFENSKKGPQFTQNHFTTPNMAIIENDVTFALQEIQQLLLNLGIECATLRDRELMQRVSKIISKRATRIAAAMVCAVITWSDPNLEKNHVVAMDGSLYELYPSFKKMIKRTIYELFDESKIDRIQLVKAEDGSGLGAAIIAATAK